VTGTGAEDARPQAGRRARIAVMPFADLDSPGEASGAPGATPGPAHPIARALAHDIISGLARLRSLFVIAQGSVFALAARGLAPQEAAQALQVDYLVSGSLRCRGERLEVSVELAQVRDQRIVWTQAFEQPRAQALQVRDLVAERIVACVAAEVELAERNRALLKPPQSLDAWEAYHRGLWHMYRFNREDNEQARRLFGQAAQADPGFAPAYAGLSFTHFQEAFQGWGPRGQQAGLAFERAGQSLEADERNPVAHWAMGRALWLRGQQAPSVRSLEQAVSLSPSFALGHYTLAFVHGQAGDPRQALVSSHEARELSPFDPLLFGMLGARAMALVRCGRFEEAAACAVEAAAQPNAHAQILG
jgi:TolB-like protein